MDAKVKANRVCLLLATCIVASVLDGQGVAVSESLNVRENLSDEDETRELQARIDALAAANGFYELAPVEWTDSHFTKQASDAGFVK